MPRLVYVCTKISYHPTMQRVIFLKVKTRFIRLRNVKLVTYPTLVHTTNVVPCKYNYNSVVRVSGCLSESPAANISTSLSSPDTVGPLAISPEEGGCAGPFLTTPSSHSFLECVWNDTPSPWLQNGKECSGCILASNPGFLDFCLTALEKNILWSCKTKSRSLH